MAIRFIEGFETEQNITWNQNVIGNQPTQDIVVDTVRSGLRAGCLKKKASDAGYWTSMQQYLTNNTNRLCISFAVYLNRINNANYHFFAIGEPNRAVRIYTRDGRFDLYGFTDTGSEYRMKSGSISVSANRWYVIEFEYINGTIDGTVKAKIDFTTPLFDHTHGDLHLSQNPNFLEFQVKTSDAYDLRVQLDDIYVFDDEAPDNTFLGCVSVVPSRVTTLGWINDFTPYGDLFRPIKNIKEMYGDVSTYFYSRTPGQIQLFKFESLPNIGNLKAIQTNYHVAKYDQYSGNILVNLLYAQDSTTFFTKSALLTDHEFENHQQILTKDPFTNNDQTTTDYNNYQIGIKFIS